MSAARAEFYGDLRRMLSLTTEVLLTDSLPVRVQHNRGARVLRNGLAVAAFARLETYLERRLSELLHLLTLSPISYGGLDQRLRRFLSVEATFGLANRLGFVQKPDQQTYIERVLSLMVGFSSSPATYTAH